VLPAILIGLVVVGSFATRVLVVQRQSITDDEEVYLLVARTLLAGHLSNRPPIDSDFLSNRFVVLDSDSWFGKYPIGHGLVLAVALFTRSLDLLPPLLGGITAWLTWLVARRSVGRRRALLALALLALSPHFVGTHATLLSQTTSALAVMAALACLSSWTRRPRAHCLLGAGFALAFGLATRPAPTAFLVPALALAVLQRRRGRAGLLALALLLSPLLIGLTTIGVVDQIQSGSVLLTGYHRVEGSLGLFSGKPGAIGLSLVGALVRENFWLLGWPLSLLPVALARPRRSRLMLWAPVLSAIAYRVVVPKTGVATTGPTYFLEAVPVLAILAADGLARAHLLTRRLAGRRGAHRLALTIVASVVTAMVFFLPVHARSIRYGSSHRGRVFRMLANRGVDRALVFANYLVRPRSGLSYAYYPPNPSPDLDDDLLFLRLPPGPDGRARAIELWQLRFSDRPAFLFEVRPRTRLRRLRPREGGEMALRVDRAILEPKNDAVVDVPASERLP